MSYDDNLRELMDQRIKLGQLRDRASGTCVSRATTGPAADVLFDGSTVAMPVKTLGSVFIQPGNRCVLERHDSEWIVTGSFSALGLGEASKSTFISPDAGPLTSSSFVDLLEISPITFDKAFDGTYVRLGMTTSAFCDTAVPTGLRYGLRFTSLSDNGYTATDYSMGYTFFHVLSTHVSGYFATRLAPFALPAGRYSVQVRWRRQSGTGQGRADGNDLFSYELDEGVATSTPIL